MKKTIYCMFLSLLFYGCGSTSSTILQNDPSFNVQNFLNSSITLFPPLSVAVAHGNSSSYSEENIKNITTEIVKSKIEGASSKCRINLMDETVPLYFRGVLLNKDAAIEFLRNTGTKYTVFVRQVLVGVKTEQQTMNQGMMNGAPLSTVFEKNTTTTTIFIDVWDRDLVKSVFSIEAEADITGGYLISGVSSSIKNAVNEFIKKLKN